MWNSLAIFTEIAKIPQTRLQEKESKIAQILEKFDEASTNVVELLRTAASK